jgi:hypothetical protein
VAAIGLLLAGVAALWGVVAQPALEWTHGRIESLQDARFDLSRARALAVSEAGLTEPNVASAERERLPLLLHGNAEAEALAEMQSIVERIARAEGLAIESMQVAPPVSQGATRAVAVEIRAQAPERAVARALAALERSRPMLRVERMQLRSEMQAMTSAGVAVAPRVVVELRLAGLWIPALAAGASPSQEPGK